MFLRRLGARTESNIKAFISVLDSSSVDRSIHLGLRGRLRIYWTFGDKEDTHSPDVPCRVMAIGRL